MRSAPPHRGPKPNKSGVGWGDTHPSFVLSAVALILLCWVVADETGEYVVIWSEPSLSIGQGEGLMVLDFLIWVDREGIGRQAGTRGGEGAARGAPEQVRILGRWAPWRPTPLRRISGRTGLSPASRPPSAVRPAHRT